MIRIIMFMCCVFLYCFSQTESVRSDIKLPNRSVVDGGISFSEELALVRNEIFARYGREFNNKKYRDFFSQFEWYDVNPNYHDGLLSEEDIRDVKIIRRYEAELANLGKKDIEFLMEVLELIKTYKYRGIDTTIFSIGDADGDSQNDTVRTKIYEKNNEIIVKYCWVKRNIMMWEYIYRNPYLYLGDSEIFQFDSRDLWIVLNVTLKYCVFQFKDFDDYKHIDLNLAVAVGTTYLKQKEFGTTEEDYKQYLQNFTGQLACYAQEEAGCNLDIWYEPLGRFIPFYRP